MPRLKFSFNGLKILAGNQGGQVKSQVSLECAGYCFLCLSKVRNKEVDKDKLGKEAEPEPDYHLIQAMTQYLKVDLMVVLITEAVFVPPQLHRMLNNSEISEEFRVELCKYCGEINDKFSKVCGSDSMDSAEKEKACSELLEDIYDEMLESEKKENREKTDKILRIIWRFNYKSGSQRVDIFDTLRQEILDKCSEKWDTHPQQQQNPSDEEEEVMDESDSCSISVVEDPAPVAAAKIMEEKVVFLQEKTVKEVEVESESYYEILPMKSPSSVDPNLDPISFYELRPTRRTRRGNRKTGKNHNNRNSSSSLQSHSNSASTSTVPKPVTNDKTDAASSTVNSPPQSSPTTPTNSDFNSNGGRIRLPPDVMLIDNDEEEQTFYEEAEEDYRMGLEITTEPPPTAPAVPFHHIRDLPTASIPPPKSQQPTFVPVPVPVPIPIPVRFIPPGGPTMAPMPMIQPMTFRLIPTISAGAEGEQEYSFVISPSPPSPTTSSSPSASSDTPLQPEMMGSVVDEIINIKRNGCLNRRRAGPVTIIEGKRRIVKSGPKKYTYQPTECGLCTKIFCSKQALLKHVNGVHLKMRNYVCSICDNKTYTQSAHLDYHMKTFHDGIREFPCSRCKAILPGKTQLRKHRSTCRVGVGVTEEEEILGGMEIEEDVSSSSSSSIPATSTTLPSAAETEITITIPI